MTAGRGSAIKTFGHGLGRARGRSGAISVTIKEIAEATGLSWPTVSQVLSGKGQRYSAATREKVADAARALGYRPNRFARAVRSGRFGCAALLLSSESVRSTLPAGLLRGIHAALAERDMDLTLAVLPDEKLTSEGFVPSILREWMADGLLINYTDHIPRRMVELIGEHRLPSVWINCRLEADGVYPDDLAAGRLATRHLIDLGHREIAYVDFAWGHEDIGEAHYSVRDRQAGYEQAMREAKLTPRVAREARRVPGTERHGHLERLLRSPGRPTGLVQYATGPETWLVAERAGLRVPEDLSIVAFANEAETVCGVAVTTLRVPQRELGAAAVEMLTARIARPGEVLPSRAIGFGLVAGGTTGPQPRRSR